MTNTRKLTIVAVLSALSFILMFYQFSFLIDFFKIDLSIVAILLALVVLDFKSAIFVTLVRSVLKLALNNKGLETIVGLPINIIAVLVFVLAFALIWNKERTHSRFVLATIIGTVGLSVSMVLVNYFYAIPLYAKFMNYDISQKFGLVHYLAAMVAPFNLIEGVIWAIVFWLVYVLLQPVLKKYEK